MSAATKWYERRGRDAGAAAQGEYVLHRGGPPTPPSCGAEEGDVPAAHASLPRAFRQRLVAALAVVHRIIGAPDYDAYLAHTRLHHPDGCPLSRDEFVRQRLEDRYSRPGARCC
jgi:uncharacterized short protein YbdD (DUF466 family)